jgi:hypothetical protein
LTTKFQESVNFQLNSKSLAEVTIKPHDSPFWKGKMKIKEYFFNRGSFKVGNGEEARFWDDTWLGNKPLVEQYSSLYNIVHHKQVTVANVLNQNPLHIPFRRTLFDNRLWLQLVQQLMEVQLTNEKDIFVWRLPSSEIFTVKSMYLDLLDNDTKYLKKYIWKMKRPLKIKVFMLFLHRKVILTKDNLVKRNWAGNETCCFLIRRNPYNTLFLNAH